MDLPPIHVIELKSNRLCTSGQGNTATLEYVSSDRQHIIV